MKRIFILEDDISISSIIEFNLRAEGYETLCEQDGQLGLDRLKNEKVDLLVLDIMLPSLSGFEVLRRLRKFSDIPVLILSARDSERDKLEGLSLMADDYITKPFSVKELTARIKVNLARCESIPPRLRTGDVELVPESMSVIKNGRQIAVSKKEYEMLRLLTENRGKVMTREQILEKVWGYNGYLGDLHTVDVAVGRLRAKIEDTPGNPRIILSRRGAGYYVL